MHLVLRLQDIYNYGMSLILLAASDSISPAVKKIDLQKNFLRNKQLKNSLLVTVLSTVVKMLQENPVIKEGTKREILHEPIQWVYSGEFFFFLGMMLKD